MSKKEHFDFNPFELMEGLPEIEELADLDMAEMLSKAVSQSLGHDVSHYHLMREKTGEYMMIEDPKGKKDGVWRLNLTVALAYAMGINQEMHDFIDEIYEGKERDETLLEGVRFPACFVENGIYVSKAYIILVEDEQAQFGDTFRLSNKAFKTSYKFFKKMDKDDLGGIINFFSYFIKRKKGNFTHEEMTKEYLNLIYLSAYIGYEEVLYLDFIFKSILLNMSAEDFDENLHESEDASNDIKLDEVIWWGKGKKKSLQEYENEIRDYFQEGGFTKRKIMGDTFVGDLMFMNFITKSMNMPMGMDFFEEQVDKDEIELGMKKIESMLRLVKEREPLMEERRAYLISLIYIKRLYVEYKKLEYFYYDTKESEKLKWEDIVDKKDMLIDKLKKEKEDWEQKKEKELEEKEERVDALSRSNAGMEKEIVELREEIEEKGDLKSEIDVLSELLKEARQGSAQERLSVENMREELESMKIAVIGGHPNWIKKMKEELDGVDYFNVQHSLGRDLSKLSDYDFVVINTKHNNHGASWKVEKNSDRIRYINQYVNTELSVKEIYDETVGRGRKNES